MGATPLGLISLIWTAGLAACLSSGQAPRLDLRTFLLSLLLLTLDLAAVRLPGAGFISAAGAVALAVGMDPGMGVAWGALTLTASLLIHAMVRAGHPQPGWRLLEHLAEGFPCLAALLWLRLIPGDMAPIWAILVYLNVWMLMVWLLSSSLPPQLGLIHRTVHTRQAWIRLAGCCCALLLAQSHNLLALAVIPILFGLRQASVQAILLQEQQQRSDVVLQLQRASSDRQNLKQGLAQKEDEYRLLQQACWHLLGSPSRTQTAARITELVGQLCLCDSIVVLAVQGDGLQAIGGRSPYPAQIQQKQDLEKHQPILKNALQSGQPQQKPEGQPGLFAGENQALAFPLGALGVLYVGRSGPPFSPESLRHLTLAASVAGLGLQISCHVEELHQALQQQREQAEQLHGWSQALAGLLDHSLHLLDSSHVEELVEMTRSAVQGLFSPLSCQVSLPARDGSTETLLTTRQEPGQARWQLNCPVLHPSLAERGLIEVHSAHPPSQRQLHLLSLLANLTAITWKNLCLRSEILAAQASLVQSAKLAAVGQLAAGVAHELNTPLGSVSLNLDMASRVLRSATPDQVQERLTRATQGLERAREIVENLLVYSRRDSAGRSLSRLDAMIEDALKLVRQPLTQKGVEIELDLQSAAEVEVVPTEIQQVLINLLLNARDAVLDQPQDRRVIRIQTRQVGNSVILAVQDQGHGIRDEDRPRLLEPFYTTKPVGQGTGLGLSICDQIARAHGGRLEFDSTVGQGSEFRLVLELPTPPNPP